MKDSSKHDGDVRLDDLREIVKAKYGEAARRVAEGAPRSCCGSAPSCEGNAGDPITRDLYSRDEGAGVPEEAFQGSLGCGNPTALAELRAGEVVLDLGSGAGLDVLLSARRVGPSGKVYGLDMTPEMLDLARKNQARAGATNVEFLQGTIESVPLPEGSVDVVISNCVINLSSDKRRAIREAFRVLRPGGRLAVSDIVIRRPLPPVAKRSMELWAGCVAGACLESEYRSMLSDAGFADVSIEPTRVYGADDAREMARPLAGDPAAFAECRDALDGAAMSAFVRATKPAR